MKSEHLLPVGVVMSLVLSLISIYRSYPLSHGLDYISLVFTALTILVAVLIGFQVVQYIFAERKLKDFAQEAADNVVQRINDDFRQVISAYSFLSSGRTSATFVVVPKAIHYYLFALQEYLSIKDSKLLYNCQTTLFEELLPRVRGWKEKNELVIYGEELDNYLALLDNFDSPNSKELKELLSTAGKAEAQKVHVSKVTV